MRADRIRPDGEAFENRVRIPFKQRPIHECSGITFVRVHDYIFCFARTVAGKFPLAPGGKSRAASSSQLRVFHQSHNLLRLHLKQGF